MVNNNYQGPRWSFKDSVAVVVVKLVLLTSLVTCDKVPIPKFQDLRDNYPGYAHYGGSYRNHDLLAHLDLHNTSNLLIHDTSALRLSESLNRIGGVHSLGTELIRLSKYGHDSVEGINKMQYIYLPIAFGPYLADKYGYPNITKIHMTDPSKTKNTFWGKQGILRVITYTVHGNKPKGHVALWDCNHFYQSKDWIAENSLLTVEFWESPDCCCTVDCDKQVDQSTSVKADGIASQSDEPLQNDESQSKLITVLKTGHMSSKESSLPETDLSSIMRHSSQKKGHRVS